MVEQSPTCYSFRKCIIFIRGFMLFFIYLTLKRSHLTAPHLIRNRESLAGITQCVHGDFCFVLINKFVLSPSLCQNSMFFLSVVLPLTLPENVCYLVLFAYRAADWKLDQPDWTGRLRIVTLGGKCFIKFEDKITGKKIRQIRWLRFAITKHFLSDTSQIPFLDTLESKEPSAFMFNIINHIVMCLLRIHRQF